MSWFQTHILNLVKLKVISEQKQRIQNKDFTLKNQTNSLWVVVDIQRSNPKAMCLFTCAAHTVKIAPVKTLVSSTIYSIKKDSDKSDLNSPP